MSMQIFRFEASETDDTGDLQTLKGTGYAGEELTQVHRVMPHGIASNAPAGSHAIAVASRGERTLVAALGLESPEHRPKNTVAGGTTIYDAGGNATRYLGTDGIWHDAGSRPQKMTGSSIEITGTTKVTLTVGDMKIIVQSGRIDLGGEGGLPVMTEGGPSSKVFAVI